VTHLRKMTVCPTRDADSAICGHSRVLVEGESKQSLASGLLGAGVRQRLMAFTNSKQHDSVTLSKA
jgi:hypothetical protein